LLRLQIDVDTFLMLGSGAGRGSYIDSDIIVDEEGLPIFPARRLKGLLRESALEVQEMLQQAELDGFLPLRIDTVFGNSNSPSVLRINNLYPPDYEETVHWLRYIRQEYEQLINKETVTSALTDVRQQTSINEDGYAQEGSLRSIRVLKAP
jgi:CRISPR/Cas system CMR subunit Cmr6 (Cas7 group RAMP superfamily)